MDPSINGLDTTSVKAPTRIWFWRIITLIDGRLDAADWNEFHRTTVKISDCPYTPNVPTPDYNYRDMYGNRGHSLHAGS